MHPRTHQEFLVRAAKLFIHARHRFGKNVAPSTDHKSGNLDLRAIDHARLPVLVVRRMILPRVDVRHGMLEALLPDFVPTARGIDQRRRHQVHREHEGAPCAKRRQAAQASARVQVVQINVVGAHDRHDRLQMRWLFERDLQRRNSAVRHAEHADVAVAPRLRGDPFHRLCAVATLAAIHRWMRDTVGTTEPAKIDQQDVVTARGEVTALEFGRGADQVVLVIRIEAEQRRETARGIGAIQIGSERGTVAQWDQNVALDFNLVLRIFHLLAPPCCGIASRTEVRFRDGEFFRVRSL